MVRVEINDIEVGESSGYIYCRDENGFTYRFSTDYEKAKLVSLLLHSVYVPTNNIYELFLKLIQATGINIQSIVILDGYKNTALINLSDGNITKSLPLSIDDALIIGLLAGSPIFIKKDACFLHIDELEQYVWYRFLKELDLC